MAWSPNGTPNGPCFGRSSHIVVKFSLTLCRRLACFQNARFQIQPRLPGKATSHVLVEALPFLTTSIAQQLPTTLAFSGTVQM